MKKIIIVNNNMKVGGVQKSLYNLLWSIDGKYDVTLCLFSKIGMYIENLPPSVKVVEVRGLFRYLGVSQSECQGFDFLKRGLLAALSKTLGRKKVLRTMNCNQPELEEHYDCAISFLHNGRAKAFYGGVQEFVLNCVNADKKVAFLHCDYRNCGANNSENNRQMEEFDVIAACSDGCRAAFESILPQMKDKCVTIRNCHRFDEIREMADDEPIIYNEDFINILIVARLSHEKGIERAIKATAVAVENHLPVKIHIVGNGVMYGELQQLARDENIDDHVTFYGEQSNPYRYMKNADLLLMTSYHEAAPMVIDEARCLGLPVMTTETTSSKDMVTDMECGWVCENSQEAINEMLVEVLSSPEAIASIKYGLQNQQFNNDIVVSRFVSLVD